MELNELKSLTIFFKTFQAIDNVARKNASQNGINMTEFSALEALYIKGKLPVHGVCSKVSIANSSMTYVLDKLEKRQLINRTRDLKDKRTYYVELTEKGRLFVEDILPNHYRIMKDIFDILSPDEKESLNELLKKVGYKAKELDI